METERVVAFLLDPEVIQKILDHRPRIETRAHEPPENRPAPPPAGARGVVPEGGLIGKGSFGADGNHPRGIPGYRSASTRGK